MKDSNEPVVIKATLEHLPDVLWIYEGARQFMREHDNKDQWGQHYPTQEVVVDDIEAGNLYLLMKDDIIMAVFCFFMGPDPTYLEIRDGQWLNDEPYGVIHRIAATGQLKGSSGYVYDWVMSQCGNIRIDTDEHNIPMQECLKRYGFKYCGVITTDNGTDKWAYQCLEKV